MQAGMRKAVPGLSLSATLRSVGLRFCAMQVLLAGRSDTLPAFPVPWFQV